MRRHILCLFAVTLTACADMASPPQPQMNSPAANATAAPGAALDSIFAAALAVVGPQTAWRFVLPNEGRTDSYAVIDFTGVGSHRRFSLVKKNGAWVKGAELPVQPPDSAILPVVRPLQGGAKVLGVTTAIGYTEDGGGFVTLCNNPSALPGYVAVGYRGSYNTIAGGHFVGFTGKVSTDTTWNAVWDSQSHWTFESVYMDYNTGGYVTEICSTRYSKDASAGCLHNGPFATGVTVTYLLTATFPPTPVIASFSTSPTPARQYQPFTLTLNGSGFDPATAQIVFSQPCMSGWCDGAGTRPTSATSTQIVLSPVTFGNAGPVRAKVVQGRRVSNYVEFSVAPLY